MHHSGYRQLAAFAAVLALRTSVVAQDLPPGFTEAQTLPPGISEVTGDAVSTRDAAWNLFIQATLYEDQGVADGTSVLKNMGFDAASADALFQHMRSSVETKKHDDLVRRASFCSKRAEIATREDLVRELDAMTAASDAERARFVDEVSQVVDSADVAKFLDEANKVRSSMSRLETDHAVYFAAQPASAVPAAVERVCNPQAQPDLFSR